MDKYDIGLTHHSIMGCKDVTQKMIGFRWENQVSADLKSLI